MVSPSRSATETVFLRMLDNVRDGRWSTGSEIPSERCLIEEFGVSRIAIREAVSMLRGLGVLDVHHGRRSRVRRVDSETLGQLLPLMLMSGGQRTFEQVFEIRLAIESQSAALAARRRTGAQIDRLGKLVRQFHEQMSSGDTEAVRTDLEFHLEIARATGNSLFPILLEALAGFVTFAQQESCRNDPARSQRAIMAHASILDAVAAADPDRARVEMEAHLRFSMTRRIDETTGVT